MGEETAPPVKDSKDEVGTDAIVEKKVDEAVELNEDIAEQSKKEETSSESKADDKSGENLEEKTDTAAVTDTAAEEKVEAGAGKKSEERSEETSDETSAEASAEKAVEEQKKHESDTKDVSAEERPASKAESEEQAMEKGNEPLKSEEDAVAKNAEPVKASEDGKGSAENNDQTSRSSSRASNLKVPSSAASKKSAEVDKDPSEKEDGQSRAASRQSRRSSGKPEEEPLHLRTELVTEELPRASTQGSRRTSTVSKDNVSSRKSNANSPRQEIKSSRKSSAASYQSGRSYRRSSAMSGRSSKAEDYFNGKEWEQPVSPLELEKKSSEKRPPVEMPSNSELFQSSQDIAALRERMQLLEGRMANADGDEEFDVNTTMAIMKEQQRATEALLKKLAEKEEEGSGQLSLPLSSDRGAHHQRLRPSDIKSPGEKRVEKLQEKTEQHRDSFNLDNDFGLTGDESRKLLERIAAGMRNLQKMEMEGLSREITPISVRRWQAEKEVQRKLKEDIGGESPSPRQSVESESERPSRSRDGQNEALRRSGEGFFPPIVGHHNGRNSQHAPLMASPVDDESRKLLFATVHDLQERLTEETRLRKSLQEKIESMERDIEHEKNLRLLTETRAEEKVRVKARTIEKLTDEIANLKRTHNKAIKSLEKEMQATEIRMRGDFEEREAKKIKELREDFERRAQARSAQSNEDRRRSHLEPSPRQRPEGLSQEEGYRMGVEITKLKSELQWTIMDKAKMEAELSRTQEELERTRTKATKQESTRRTVEEALEEALSELRNKHREIITLSRRLEGVMRVGAGAMGADSWEWRGGGGWGEQKAIVGPPAAGGWDYRGAYNPNYR